MLSGAPIPEIDHCVIDQWPLTDRIESLLYATNTLSGIVAFLCCNDEPRSTSQIRKRIAKHGFGADPDTASPIHGGAIREQLSSLSEAFSLIDAYEETRPPTKGRGGRLEPTDVTVFKKDPRGHWFGDPLAARVLTVCADLNLSPVDIFTSAAKKGETRAPVTTALILSALGPETSISEKELLQACFWTPAERSQYNRLRYRVNKNIKRLTEVGLLKKESHQELILQHTGTDLDTYPQRQDGSRHISETDRIIAHLEEHDEVRRQTLVNEVQAHHLHQILDHLRDKGVVEQIQGGIDDRTRIALTEAGRTVVNQIINPLLDAVAPEFSLSYNTRVEYEELLATTPPVDEEYLTETFRAPLKKYTAAPDQFRADIRAVNRIDQARNPWR